jgi:C-methyltransferase C-terminal domain/Methyltransferase domain/Putative zinc binding domain
MKLKTITHCRICGSAALTPAIDLGPQYLQGAFVKEGLPKPSLEKIPTALVRCDPSRDKTACGLLQTRVTVPGEVLYESYWYRSGTNQTMRDHLAGIAAAAAERVGKASARVLDIGCNDGTLLRSYPAAFRKVGVDPSDAAQGLGGGIEVVNDFFPSKALPTLAGPGGFDIITSIAMFYDLDDPVGFVTGLAALLAAEGLWVLEMSYMPTMLELNSYDTICHEHIEYYSLAVIEALLARAGLKVVDVAFNAINGGSLRCYAAHQACTRHDRAEAARRIAEVRTREAGLALGTDRPYRDFQTRIEAHRAELGGLIEGLRAEGKRIHIYGASTKGNTILQWCGLDHRLIECAADRNPDKDGARTLGTDIPIVSEARSRAMAPDYYLVLPWHFRDEFLAREADARAKGVKFIFPLPSVEIV